jgi:hypothetical protein
MKNDATKQGKRAFPAVLLTAALLAALLAGGCELFVQRPEQGANTETDDGLGNGVLKISVGGGNSGASRAMIGDIARNAVNYYEVIFYDGSDYTRIAWYKGQSVRLAVPPGNYDGDAKKAILLAGTNNAGTNGQDYTLLAIGKLTKTSVNSDGTGATNGTTITVATKWVQFTLYALEAAPSTAPALSSFKILTPDASKTEALVQVPAATMTSGAIVPYFALPKNNSTITAEYEIKLLASELGGAGSPKLGSFLKFHRNPGTLTTAGVFSDQGDEGVNLVEGNGTQITNAADSDLAGGKITMQMQTPDRDGLSLLQIDAQVLGMGGRGIVWHIRGGLFNYQLDSITGSSEKTNSTGGGILLAVGSAGNPGISINTAPVTVVQKTGTLGQVAKGSSTTQFEATLWVSLASHGVTWGVSGADASGNPVATPLAAGTGINASGLLTVDASEGAAKLIVKATSVADTAKFGTVTVTVVP